MSNPPQDPSNVPAQNDTEPHTSQADGTLHLNPLPEPARNHEPDSEADHATFPSGSEDTAEMEQIKQLYERKLELLRHGCVDEELALWALQQVTLGDSALDARDEVTHLKKDKPYLFSRQAQQGGRLADPVVRRYGQPSLPPEAGRLADLAGLDVQRRSRLARRLRAQSGI